MGDQVKVDYRAGLRFQKVGSLTQNKQQYW